ncbi:SusE domain-containing protein [Dysgonomonas sp. 511]|uniref:SusE domain-containing protein n=1 Tax=Dysgonomonas sp. 511 TaxID=2302930 RepID=UPI0013D07B14|nr:SusE domain-containing protein [Dysgonomonas sp. 511]NDV78243.1 hypothetical protein [Dysgonomonas sp. 511]
MKKLNIFFLLGLFTLIFVACDNDDDKIKLNSGDLVYPSFTMESEQGFEVTASTDQTQEIGTWEWSKAAFGLNSPITYVVVADTLESFATEVEVIRYTSSNKEEPVTIKLLNDAAATLTKESKEVTLYVTVKAILGSSGNTGALYASEKKAIDFTCYYFKPKAALYIVGNGLVGWDNTEETIGNNLQVFFSDDNGSGTLIYTYTGYFTGGNGLKFPTLAGDWDKAYGYSNGSLIPNNGGGDYTTPATSGLYTLTVNLKTMALTMEPYTDAVTSYEKIGIVGDGANGWPEDDNITDIAMTKYAEHVWVATNVKLTAGKEIKFRANEAWTVNWGVESGEEQGLPFTVGKVNGDNIKVLKTTEYFVAFNDITNHIIVIPMDDLPKKTAE